jgi:5-methylcytosine-specific restriction endonuclease McrA
MGVMKQWLIEQYEREMGEDEEDGHCPECGQFLDVDDWVKFPGFCTTCGYCFEEEEADEPDPEDGWEEVEIDRQIEEAEIEEQIRVGQVSQAPHWPHSSPMMWERYLKYLDSPEWAKLREAVRARCKNRCERCQMWRMEHVHHISYDMLFQERLTDLVGLCEACHKFIHGHRSADPILTRWKRKMAER